MGSLGLVLAGLMLLPMAGCGGGSGGTKQLPVTVAIGTHPDSVLAGDSYTFTATVANGTNGVKWSVTCAQGVSDCGAIGGSTGVYKAPPATSQMQVTVTAVSVDDATKSDTWAFKVVPKPTTVKIDNAPAWINAGLSYKFTATVTGPADTTVAWTLACGTGVSQCGSLAADGTYTTPVNVSAQVSFTVTATSNADNTKADSAIVALLPAIAVAIAPGTVGIVNGFAFPFTATVQNDMGNVGVTWTVNGVEGGNAQVGTISAVTDPYAPSNLIAMYTAPVTTPADPVTVAVISKVDTKKSAGSAVTLIANPHPGFKGDFAFLVNGGTEAAGGILTLDGKGGLTGKLDVHVGGYPGQDQIASGLDVTGTYGFEGSTAGWGTMTYASAGQSVTMGFRLVFYSDTVAKVMQFDGMGSTMGTIEKQASDFATALDGNTVFALTGFQLSPTQYQTEKYAILGQMHGTAGGLAGAYDLVDVDPQHKNHGLTGTYGISGKEGTANLGVTAGNGMTISPDMFLYPVSASRALVMSKTAPFLLGWIDQQSGDVFSTASLNGEWVFYSASAPDPTSATLGRFTSDGKGTSGPGCIDAEGSSSGLPPACYPMFDLGTYTIDGTGRGFAPQTQWGMPRPAYLYFIDADHGRFGTQGGLGEFFRVNGAPFNNATLNGTYTVAFGGMQNYFSNATQDDELGTIRFDGNGNAKMQSDWNDLRDRMLMQDYERNGTYSFDSGLYATGERGTLTLGDDMQLVYYALSGDKVLMIQFSDSDTAFGIAQRVSKPE
jgi:hypothetical protein